MNINNIFEYTSDVMDEWKSSAKFDTNLKPRTPIELDDQILYSELFTEVLNNIRTRTSYCIVDITRKNFAAAYKTYRALYWHF